MFEDLVDDLTLLTREGIKFGIYFVITADSVNSVRFRVQQNFKTMYALQLNDSSDYSVIVGNTDGLVPAKYKGRGLVNIDKPYEFQIAYCTTNRDIPEFIREFTSRLNHSETKYALPIPVLPDRVDYEFVSKQIGDIGAIPVGVAKESLKVVTFDFRAHIISPVICMDIDDAIPFSQELVKVLSSTSEVMVIDPTNMISQEDVSNCENLINDLFVEMVTRNNIYIDSGRDASSLDDKKERVYVLVGLNSIFDRLSEEGVNNLRSLLENGDVIYKINVIAIDTLAGFNEHRYEEWFTRHVSNGDGIWIGDGISDQDIMRIGTIPRNLYEDIGPDYGFRVFRGKTVCMKLLSSGGSEQI